MNLAQRIHADDLYWQICKIVTYVGFPFRELAEKMRPLVEKHGAMKVSKAMQDLVGHVGWRTMLTKEARIACWGVLGPPPEKWDEFYTTWDGKPMPRPKEHETPPVIPEREIEPILDSLARLTATELDMKLRLSWAELQKDVPNHERQLALETIPRVESEMVRRGQDIPAEEENAAEEKKPRRTRAKKG